VTGEPTRSTEPGSVRLALTLGVVGLIAGLVLVGAYEFTRPMILANKARALHRAVNQVVPGSTKMQELIRVDGKLRAPKKGEKGERVYAAYADDGSFRGFAIPAEGPGFQDTIVLIYGYDPDQRKLTGMKVLESRETPGLGDKIFKDTQWVSQFNGIAVDPKLVVKKNSKSAANELDAITGATISSKAVTKIINNSNKAWLEALPKAAEAPALPKPAASEETK
jgi:electron transport complex protein RnfG